MMSGANFWSILVRDVLPYLLSYVVMAFVLQVSGAILFEATLSMLGLGPSGAVSLGVMLYWAIAWGSVRTGAWWAFVPPTVMLTLISFSLLLLQSSLDELFNPRLRRGRMKRKPGTGSKYEIPAAEGPAPSLSAGRGHRGSGTDPRQPGGTGLMAELLNAQNIRGVYYTPSGAEVVGVDNVSHPDGRGRRGRSGRRVRQWQVHSGRDHLADRARPPGGRARDVVDRRQGAGPLQHGRHPADLARRGRVHAPPGSDELGQPDHEGPGPGLRRHAGPRRQDQEGRGAGPRSGPAGDPGPAHPGTGRVSRTSCPAA